MANVVKDVLAEVNWTSEDLATRVDLPTRKIDRWLDGRERPDFARLFALEELRWPIIVALARLGGGEVTEEGVIRIVQRPHG
jgi:hypothetical protein